MKSTTVSDAKNRLSYYLDHVKGGETIVITDRGRPVARLEPIPPDADPGGRRERLTRPGLMRAAAETLPEDVLAGPLAELPAGVSAVDAVISERQSGW